MSVSLHPTVQVPYQNPDAANTLYMPVIIKCNTDDETLAENIRVNSAKTDLRWMKAHEVNNEPAIMVGGGATAAEFLDVIKNRQRFGGKIFAMNGASQWLREHHIEADYQCVLDAKEETALLVDTDGPTNIIASQVHPSTMDAADDPIVWHLEIGEIEDHFPADRRKAGDYVLSGGGASCGNSAMAVAYALGHRKFHVFGYDCSYADKKHAYEQSMNNLMPSVEMEWDGKTYHLSIGMKGQIMAFQIMATELKRHGCEIEMYGDAILQHVYNTKTNDMSERDKYRTMWNWDDYRATSPGETCVDQFLEIVKPRGQIVDLGCGTGRASLRLKEKGHTPFLVDFADNCRDHEALNLPFLEWDLMNELPITAPYGFCCDVMEHIPPEDVDQIIRNVMKAGATTYFQISTIQDYFGKLFDTPLHLSVHPVEWWENKFNVLGYAVTWHESDEISCRFVVTTED